MVKTRTATQIKTHAENYFKILSKNEDEKTRLKKFRQSLPPEKKARIAEDDAAAHQKHRKSLPPEKKARIAEDDAATHQKHRKSLPPEKKARIAEDDAVAHKSQRYLKSIQEEMNITAQIKQYAATLHTTIHLDQGTIEFLRDHFYKDPTLALAYYYCCSTDPRAAIFNDELGSNTDTSAIWSRISNLIGDPIGQKESKLCHQTFKDIDQSHAKIAACASCCERLLSSDGKKGLVKISIDDLPPAFLLTNDQKQGLALLPHDIVMNHVQVLQHNNQLYHLNPDLVFDFERIILCPICAKDPLAKDQESIAAGNDYGRLGNLKPLNGTTRNACMPIRLYNIDLQIRANHSTNHSIAFPMTGPIECSKVLPCVNSKHQPQVTFLGPKDEWRKLAGNYKYLYEMDTENAYSWLYVWVGAKHHSFEGCSVNTSDEIRQQMNSVTKEIMQNAITTDDSTITGVSTMLDAVNEDNIEIMNDTNATASPYMVHSAVLPKPSLIDATVNSAIKAMWNIIQPDDTIINDTLLDHEFLSNDNHGRYRPVIPVSRESNEPIIEWTDNDKLLCGAFPDKFILGQGVPKGLLSERNWRHFANYYDGRFEDPLFIAHGFNQLQRAACIRSSARITGKNTATLKSLGQLTNSKAFREQLVWARDHPHSKEAKSLNAKLCRILSMVGSTIPFSPFERAATWPKLNAMRFRYGIGSNFITGAPPKFEDLLTLRLCMNPKLNDPNCQISKQDFKRIDLPDHVRNDTAIRLRMTALCPLLQAQNFQHKLRILLEAVIGCKSSSDTRRSLDYLMYDRRAYHQIAAFNGVIEPQASGRLHWHIMLY